MLRHEHVARRADTCRQVLPSVLPRALLRMGEASRPHGRVGFLGGAELLWPPFPGPVGRYEVHVDSRRADVCARTHVRSYESVCGLI